MRITSPLTNDTIIDQVKSGFSADLKALKSAGVPDSVIAAMLDKK